jgi:hypothetical protein
MDEVGEIETEGCDWGCMGVPPPPQLHIPKMSDNTKLVGPVPTVNLVVDHDSILTCTSNLSLRAGPVVDSRKVSAADPELVGCGSVFDYEAGLIDSVARNGKREQKE